MCKLCDFNTSALWILAAVVAFGLAAASFFLHYPCEAINTPSANVFLDGFFSSKDID